MKHIQGFYEATNESQIATKDTTKTTFNIGSLIQIVDENDKNIGQATFKKALKTMYHVQYKGKILKVDKKDLSLKEGIELAIEAIKSSTQRDSASGNGIDVVTITKDGINKVIDKEIIPEFKDRK